MAEEKQEPPRHGGAHAVAAARRRGVSTMFTLSGGHVFPLYDGAVKADPPMRMVDVRHEQTAVFAAEATARLTRAPGLAVVTAGPGVTNTVSAITTAWFNGSPVVVLGGRAPDYRWGSGGLQEIDHPPLLAPVTKRAWTEHRASAVGTAVDEAFRLATAPHRGPVFVDFAMEALFGDGGAPAQVVHVADSPGHLATHRTLAASAAGDLTGFFTALAAAVPAAMRQAGAAAPPWADTWLPRLAAAARDAIAADQALLTSD